MASKRTESKGAAQRSEKKVRIAGESDGVVTEPEKDRERVSVSPVVTDRLSVRANDVMKLKLVASTADFDDTTKEFAPTYTHQIFAEEKISGYLEPMVNVFASASGLYLFVRFGFEKKTDDADPVMKKIAGRIQGQWTDNKAVFLRVSTSVCVCVCVCGAQFRLF